MAVSSGKSHNNIHRMQAVSSLESGNWIAKWLSILTSPMCCCAARWVLRDVICTSSTLHLIPLTHSDLSENSDHSFEQANKMSVVLPT